MDNRSDLYIGIMTGTSNDQADLVVADLSGMRCQIVGQKHFDIPYQLRESINKLCQPEKLHSLKFIANTQTELSLFYVECVNKLLKQVDLSPKDIKAIGCHGQTIWHAPEDKVSWQLGDGHLLAAKTSIKVVMNFRQLDVVLNGQGAPLVPLFQQNLCHSAEENRVLLNLGGIANITVLPKLADWPIYGFDTGPANTLIDQWFQQHQLGLFDKEGSWAAQGHIHDELLDSMLLEPYFQDAVPKSTGREKFNLTWIKKHLQLFPDLSSIDVQATCTELTAVTVSQAIEKYAETDSVVYVFGGGLHNTFLMQRIRKHLPQSFEIKASLDIGIDGDIMEAICFAWLAKQRVENLKLDARSITGSQSAHTFGTVYLPS